MTSSTASLPLIPIGPNFWNLRGSFVLFHFIDIGTQMSFIRLKNGRFLVIDTCAIDARGKAAIDELTNNGELIEAVLGTHPFHTMYFKPFHQMYPNARYYGCPRHLKKVDIPWTGNILDDAIMNAWAEDGIIMRVPDGTDILTPAEDNHLSTVFVFHQESRTIHIDDTVMVFENPGCVLRCMGKHVGQMEFWAGGFKKGLKNSKEAPEEFKNFIQYIIDNWDFDNLCTAHVGNMIGGAKALLQDTLNRAVPALDHIAQSR
jgi:hypothetical protein